MRRKNWELKGIFWIITLLFVGFLAAPILLLLGKSLLGDGGLTGEFYVSVVTRDGFLTALGNSFAVAAASAVVATIIAFLMAYAVHYTELPKWAKRLITAIATLPMFLPTITYGFAIIYSFGRQGLLTRLLGRQFFDIYGFGGLLVGYVIYTIPVAFLLIHNTMGFVDKKTIIVTHDPEEALTLSDRVLIIDQGTISQYAKPDEIIHQPKNDFVRKFILRQLEIKRGNIYALFGDRPQLAGEAV